MGTWDEARNGIGLCLKCRSFDVRFLTCFDRGGADKTLSAFISTLYGGSKNSRSFFLLMYFIKAKYAASIIFYLFFFCVFFYWHL